jgi:hypothetical protein
MGPGINMTEICTSHFPLLNQGLASLPGESEAEMFLSDIEGCASQWGEVTCTPPHLTPQLRETSVCFSSITVLPIVLGFDRKNG